MRVTLSTGCLDERSVEKAGLLVLSTDIQCKKLNVAIEQSDSSVNGLARRNGLP